MNKLRITSERIKKALDFATKAHEGTYRNASNLPYVVHPIEVASIIQTFHPENENAIIGALLHDTVEDTDITFQNIEDIFGKEVAKIVRDVTDDESDLLHLEGDERKYARRKRQLENYKNICFEAKLIRLGDKTSNIRDINEVKADFQWKRKYVGFVEEVYNGLKDVDSPMVRNLGEMISQVNAKLDSKSVDYRNNSQNTPSF